MTHDTELPVGAADGAEGAMRDTKLAAAAALSAAEVLLTSF